MTSVRKWNSRFSLVVAVLALSVLIAGISGIGAADEWPMFHHDLQHTGNSTSIAPITNNTLWTYPTYGQVSSSPAVVNGVVYVGSFDDHVYALDATTGAYIWNFFASGPVYSSPAVSGGMVYVGSFDDNVYALNATTGAYIWNYPTGSLVLSSPAVAGGMVYVGSFDSNVYALNATTGAYIWNFPTSDWVLSSPAVSNGVVFVGSDDGNVYGLNATTGAYIWNYPTSGSVQSSPAVSNGVVYVGSDDGNVYGLNATTGAYIWNTLTGAEVYSSPAVAGGVVYVCSDDQNVYALNATTGLQIWSCPTGSGVSSSPAVAGGVVYVGSGDSNVYALNATTGTTVWNYTTGGGVDSSPAVANTKVYVGSEDGNVYCFGLLYKVTFAESGVTGYSGTVLVVDGTDNLKVSDLPKSYWFDAGTSHTFAFQSPLSEGSDKRYAWASTSGLSGGQWGTFNVTGAGNITGNYNTQWRVTFGQSGVGPDFTSPYSNYSAVVTVDGKNYGVKDLPVQLWFDGSSSHSFAYKSPLVVATNNTQYTWNSTNGLSSAQSGSIVASASGNVTGNYKKQYYLNMIAPPSTTGTISPKSGWQYAGTKLNISATATPQYTFQSWLGIGTGSYAGTKKPSSITMNSTITEVSVFAKKSTH